MQIIFLLAVLSLPLVILLDSKKRLGSPRWGWALISGFVLVSTLGQVGREVGISGSFGVAELIGGLTGAWLGLFALYRGSTRKKTPQPEQGQKQVDSLESSAATLSNEQPESCPNCGMKYLRSEYDPNAAVWSCLGCKNLLTRR